MKNLFIAAALATGLATALAGRASQNKVTVDEIKFSYDYLWNDTIGFGSESPNYGCPDTVGVWRGATVTFGYDYNYLTHFITIGDDIMFDEPAYLVENVDRHANRATFTHGMHRAIVDFNRADALSVLGELGAIPEGWRRDGVTFSYDVIMMYDKADTLFMPVDTRIVAIYPEKEPAKSRYFSALGDCFKLPSVTSLEQLAAGMTNLEKDYGHGVRPAAPNRRCNPMEGFNSTIYFFPDYVRGDTVTIGKTINSTYPAGGCRSSRTDYSTYILSEGRCLTPADIFDPAKASRIVRLYIEGVAANLVTFGLGDYDENEEKIIPYTPSHVADILGINEKSGLSAIPYAALCANGVIVDYDLADFTDFGEDPRVSFVIPYASIP